MRRATYERAFKEAVAALRDDAVPFACMGSLALWALGGPLPNLQQDLDFAVCEEDAPRAANALRGAGFAIQVPEEDWLFKAWSGEPDGHDSALVDIIFAPSGIHVTRDLLEACEHRSVLALDVPVLSATDLLTTKLHAINELNADYTSTLQFARSLREQVDWAELDGRMQQTPFGEAFMLLVDRLGLHGEGPAPPRRPMAAQRHATSHFDDAEHRATREELLDVVRGQGGPKARERRGRGRETRTRGPGPILGSRSEHSVSEEYQDV